MNNEMCITHVHSMLVVMWFSNPINIFCTVYTVNIAAELLTKKIKKTNINHDIEELQSQTCCTSVTLMDGIVGCMVFLFHFQSQSANPTDDYHLFRSLVVLLILSLFWYQNRHFISWIVWCQHHQYPNLFECRHGFIWLLCKSGRSLIHHLVDANYDTP